MQVFDQIDVLTIDRREWHLWLLAFAVILVLALGIAVLMYPTAFSSPVILTGTTMRKVFFGFCTLTFLLLGYLLDRQLVIRELRRELMEEQVRNVRIRHQASVELLETLPGFSHFQDRLAMEYRRANTTQQPLSMLVVSLIPSRDVSDPKEIDASFGDAAKAVLRRLRREDSIYLFREGVFGIVLPGTSGNDAYHVSERLAEGLRDASGASDRFTFDLRVVNYPEHTASAREMEQVARSFLPEGALAARAA
jgi:GGDEF domain-containing protein